MREIYALIGSKKRPDMRTSILRVVVMVKAHMALSGLVAISSFSFPCFCFAAHLCLSYLHEITVLLFAPGFFFFGSCLYAL